MTRVRALSLSITLLVGGCGRDEPSPKPRPVAPPVASVPADPWVVHDAAPFDRARVAKLPVTDPIGHVAPLGDRLREVTVLVFWASWCEPCLHELPQLDRFAATMHDDRVAVIAIDLDEASDRAQAIKAAESLHLKLPIVFDPDATTYHALFGSLGIVIPATAIVSRDGAETSAFAAYESDEALVAHFKARVAAQLHD